VFWDATIERFLADTPEKVREGTRPIATATQGITIILIDIHKTPDKS
jgi:hypothetical protein